MRLGYLRPLKGVELTGVMPVALEISSCIPIPAYKHRWLAGTGVRFFQVHKGPHAGKVVTYGKTMDGHALMPVEAGHARQLLSVWNFAV